MPECLAAGVTTYYQRIGQGRPVVLLLHGWGNDWTSWSSLVPLLVSHFTLLIPDLPGFGRSRMVSTTGWTMADYSRWLGDFLKEQQVSQLAAVLGHSFGGKIAMFGWLNGPVALPAAAEGLFLLSPSGIEPQLSWYRRLIQFGLGFIPHNLKRRWLPQVREWYYTKLLNEVDYLRSDLFQEATLRHILKEDIRTQVKRPSAMPFHIVWGERDPAVPLWMAYELNKLSTDSSVFVVTGAGHHVHQDAPAAVQQWLQATLLSGKV
jgi:pimeloyl-ACP methyl ester carboxylesterase